MDKHAGVLGWGLKKGINLTAKTGDALAHGVVHSPGQTAMGVGGLALTVPALKTPPEAKAKRKINRELSRRQAQQLKRTLMPNTSMAKSAAVLPGASRLYEQEELEKQAARLPKPHELFLLGAGLALGNQAIEGLSSGAEAGFQGIKDGMRAKTRQSRWRRVVKFDNDLQDLPHARAAFDALDRASPYLSGEPMLAASAVRQLASYGSSYEGGPPNVPMSAVKSVLDIQRGRGETRAGMRRTGAFGATKVDAKDGAEILGVI